MSRVKYTWTWFQKGFERLFVMAVLEVGVGWIYVLWSACRRGGDISITPRERDISPLSSHHRQSNVSSRACDTPPLMTSVCFNIQMFPKKKWWRRSSWFKVALSLIATWRRWKKVAYWRNWSEAKGDFSIILSNIAKIYRAISQRLNLRDYLTSSYPHLPLYGFSEEQSAHEIVRLTAELTTLGKRTNNWRVIFWIRCCSFHFVVGQSKTLLKLQSTTKVNYLQPLFAFISHCMHNYSFTSVYKC